MEGNGPQWLAPTSLDEALGMRAELQEEATVVAGGTFVGVLMNVGFMAPAALLSLRGVPGLSYIRADGELRIGPMTTHRAMELSPDVRRGWPALARAFGEVASPRVRNQATVGGVLADADYASDPPAMFLAMGARAVLRGPKGVREVPIENFILGYYETALAPDELLVEVRVPGGVEAGVYRKFRTRSSEDRPCVSVAAVRRGGELRLAVGAATSTPQYFPDLCAAVGSGTRRAREIGEEYASRIEPISDSRGSAEYRRRVIAVEVRRALEELAYV
ncbi:MAG: FAD binding domain-containing protein [Rhodothermales bacterium]|nr:FAD binding domain-containing protein [Rhodothermales bacterium]